MASIFDNVRQFFGDPAGANRGRAGGGMDWLTMILGGNNPYLRNVTANAGIDDTGTNFAPTSFATPSQPNVNYATPEAAGALASYFGGQVNQQPMTGFGPAGAPSDPMQTISFDPNRKNYLGYEVNIPAGQLAHWGQRGDQDWEVAARLGLIADPWGGRGTVTPPGQYSWYTPWKG